MATAQKEWSNMLNMRNTATKKSLFEIFSKCNKAELMNRRLNSMIKSGEMHLSRSRRMHLQVSTQLKNYALGEFRTNVTTQSKNINFDKKF